MARGAERLGQREGVVDLVVGHDDDAVHLDDLDEHAGVFVLRAERLHAVHRDRFPPLAKLLGVLGLALRGVDLGDAEEGFDWLRPQLDAAQAELEAVLQDVIAAHDRVGEAVGHVEADLDAGHLRIGLGRSRICRAEAAGRREQGRSGQRRKGELGEFTTSLGERHRGMGNFTSSGLSES